MHTTALLGAVAILDATRQRWSGTFHALFQPAEEVTAGAGAMVRDGLADEISRPDLCLGQHIVPGKAGTIMSMPGAALAACDSITVTIHGTSAHASSPHQSVDPIYVAAHVILRLQGIVGREVDPGEFAVVSVGQIHAGNTNNSIPDTATLTLNCRFYNTDVRDHVYRAIERVIRAECEASGCPAEPDIEYWAHGELTDNDPAVFSHVRETFDAVFGDSSIDAERWTASEDFSEIPRHFDVPYLFWTAGITPDEQWEKRDETPVPANHMATFLPDLSTISSTTKAAAAAPLSFLFKE
jgi:amidohydrolase